MQYRTIGDLNLSLLGLGTSRLASMGAHNSRSTVANLIAAAEDAGVNFIDTADTYGSSACERTLGQVLSHGHPDFYIATKAGFTVLDLPRPLRALNQPGKKVLSYLGRRQNFSATNIARRIDDSLRRLRREAIDLYFLHEPSIAALRDEDLMEALTAAVASGKIRHLGVSGDDPQVIRAASCIPEFSVVQTRLPDPPPAPDPISHDQVKAVIVNQVLRSVSSPLYKMAERASLEQGLPPFYLLLRHAAVPPAVRVVLTGTSNPKHIVDNAVALCEPVTADDELTRRQ
jgi:aryl-alcohol dehydrogenase-like predicted oxidoreductase